MADFNKARSELINKIPAGKEKEYDEEIFEQNLFVTWGDRCLDIKRPGTYTIVAEVTNDYVVQSPCESNSKTAVGTIRSTPLTINIID
jgi:hypothetical protein